jgi:hypothetical protein
MHISSFQDLIAKSQNYHFVIFCHQKTRFFGGKLSAGRKKRRNSGVDKNAKAFL